MTCQRACIEAAWSCRAVEEHTEDKTDALMLKGERGHGSKCTAERIKQGPERPQRLRCCLARPGCREKNAIGWVAEAAEMGFLTALEAGVLRSRRQPSRILVHTHLLACRWPPSHCILVWPFLGTKPVRPGPCLRT